jgi:hypothetical protein
MENKYKSYMVSLGEVIHEYTLEAIQQRKEMRGTESEEFTAGYLSGFHRIVTLMQQHAESYDISLSELSLEDIDESDLF